MSESTNWQRMRELAPFAPQAFRFVQEGLQHTLAEVRGRDDGQESPPPMHAELPSELLGELFDLDEEQLAEMTQGEAEPVGNHVSGQELCLGLRSLAVEKYGSLAMTVLHGWGVTKTEDFGKIVYAMVDAGLLRTSENDSMDDFRGVYEFNEAFDSLRDRTADCAGGCGAGGCGANDVG